MGQNGILHYSLQQEFILQKVPFKVVGGASFLNSEVCRDLLAYLNLTLTGSQNRTDDDAFARVLNKPPRKLPKEALDLMRAKRSTMEQEGEEKKDQDEEGPKKRPVGLEEAARDLLGEENAISKARAEGLKAYFDLLYRLRVTAISEPLPDLLLKIWEETGLAAWHEKKATSKAKSKKGGNEDQGDEMEDENKVSSDATPGKKYRPAHVEILVAVAKTHADERKESKENAAVEQQAGIESLFFLAKQCLMDKAAENPYLPQLYLPQPLLDELHLPGGRGLPVVDSFLADLALQMTTPDDGTGDDEDDRVTISTIHRAKGLEWKEVFVPYFNEGFMPTQFREEDKTIPTRHIQECSARRPPVIQANGLTQFCKQCDCARHYAKKRAQKRHRDEERRLAHVAATRAKDRLVFVSLQSEQFSSFHSCLDDLPHDVFE